jgi:hypothetical protein
MISRYFHRAGSQAFFFLLLPVKPGFEFKRPVRTFPYYPNDEEKKEYGPGRYYDSGHHPSEF